MSRGVHLLSNNVTGFGLSDSRCLPCSGVSGRAATVSSCSLCAEHRINSGVKLSPLRCTSLGASFMCKASSGGHRRNPDFSKQNRHGFSRSRNRQNEGRESVENLEDSDLLSSKNGPLLSLSSAPKSQATATPGPREKEIVELFRKVQAQLRERAAMEEEKKMEAQGQSKGSETVDSLLKLLRKHSVEQGKRSSGGGSKDFSFSHIKENGQYDEGKGTSIFGLSGDVKDKTEEPTMSSFSRPVSNFQRKSPVPRVKYQPIYSGESTVDSIIGVNSADVKFNDEAGTSPRLKLRFGAQQKTNQEPRAKLQRLGETAPVPEADQDFKLEPEHESYELEHEPDEMEPDLINLLEDVSSDVDEAFDNDNKGNQKFVQRKDLGTLKLPELRAIAKSQGLKGFSKMKKSDLVQLLSEAQV